MNFVYARNLVVIMLLVIAAFSLVRGVASIRLRTESTIIGILRIALSLLMVVALVTLLIWLGRSEQTA